MREARPTLTILSCNIRKALPEDELAGNGWDARKELCAQVILSRHPDVICLQESLSTQLRDLKSRLGKFDSFGLADPDTVFHPGNAILFRRKRFAMVSAGGFWLSETPHVAGSKSWDSARSRFANWVDLEDRTAGIVFRVWNSHLDHIGQVARERQARHIVEASEALPEDLPQLFAVDANADAFSTPVEVLKAGGWRDTYIEAHGPEDPGYTFHAFLGVRLPENRPPEKVKGKIDFIFCRGPVEVLAAEVIRDEHDGRYPSDHYFVSAEVTFGQ